MVTGLLKNKNTFFFTYNKVKERNPTEDDPGTEESNTVLYTVVGIIVAIIIIPVLAALIVIIVKRRNMRRMDDDNGGNNGEGPDGVDNDPNADNYEVPHAAVDNDGNNDEGPAEVIDGRNNGGVDNVGIGDDHDLYDFTAYEITI